MIHNRGVSTSFACLVLFIGLYLMGAGYLIRLTQTATGNQILLWNRIYFYMLTGAILIGIYAWTNFKPSKLSTRQYIYNSWDWKDLPDKLFGILTWGTGRSLNKSSLENGEEPSEPTMYYYKKKLEEYKSKKNSQDEKSS